MMCLAVAHLAAAAVAQVQEDVRPSCLYNDDTGFFGLPSPEDLAAKHIVVCTCTAAGRTILLSANFGHKCAAWA